MEISPEKCETMKFSGHNSVRIKFIVENNFLQPVKHCIYLGCEISCENKRYATKTTKTFSNM
jgi:hypothetical protein